MVNSCATCPLSSTDLVLTFWFDFDFHGIGEWHNVRPKGGSPDGELKCKKPMTCTGGAAISGAAGEVITRYHFTYPGRDPIELIFFRVRQFSGEPQNLIFHDLRWQPKFQLATLDFVEGDREFIHGIYTSAYGNHD